MIKYVKTCFYIRRLRIKGLCQLKLGFVGIPMGTNCAPLVADLFLFCYDRDFMLSLSEDNQYGVIEAFNSTSRYLDDLLNIDNNFFDSMVNRIYPSELQLNKANISDAEASFLDLHLSISDGFVKTKIYDKRDDFDFDIVNFPFLDGDVGWLVVFGLNDPLRQYFSLYRVVSKREGERREMIDESKNVQTTPTRTYCKSSRPLPYSNPNK